MPVPRAALDVDGALRVASPRSAITVRGERARVVVDARDGRALGDLWALRRGRRPTALRAIAARLASSDLTVDLALAEQPFFHLGSEARPGPLMRLVLGPHASLRPLALLRAWIHQRRRAVRT